MLPMSAHGGAMKKTYLPMLCLVVLNGAATAFAGAEACVAPKPKSPADVTKIITALGKTTPNASESLLLNSIKIADLNEYQLCLDAQTLALPLTIRNVRSLPVSIFNLKITNADLAITPLTLVEGVSSIRLVQADVMTNSPNALKITGANHKLVNVTLNGNRSANSFGLQLTNATNFTADNLIIKDFATGISADAASTATLTKPQVLWNYQPSAATMQGTIGVDLQGPIGGNAIDAMGMMMGSDSESVSVAPATLVTLEQPIVKGFVQGIKVVAGKKLVLNGGEVWGYPSAATAQFDDVRQWPGETGVLLNGNDHVLGMADTLDDAQQPIRAGTLIRGFREQLSLEGDNIMLDHPTLELADMTGASVNRCWTRANGATDCGAKGIDGLTETATNIDTVQFTSVVVNSKTSYNFVYYSENDRSSALQNSVILGKRCSRVQEVTVLGAATEVCADGAEGENFVEKIIGILPAATCDDGGEYRLMITKIKPQRDNMYSNVFASSCAIEREPKTISLLVKKDMQFELQEYSDNTCRFVCDQTAGTNMLQVDGNTYLSILQQLPTGYVQIPIASDVDHAGSYEPLQASKMLDIKPSLTTTPGMQTASIESPSVSGPSGPSAPLGVSGDVPSVPSTPTTPDLPGTEQHSSDSDAGDAATNADQFTGALDGGSGVISNNSDGGILGGAGALGMKSGCSLVIE